MRFRLMTYFVYTLFAFVFRFFFKLLLMTNKEKSKRISAMPVTPAYKRKIKEDVLPRITNVIGHRPLSRIMRYP